jgi:hypothetical protein
VTEHVKIQENGAVLEILFARPEKKNALSNAMYRAMSDALESARTNNSTRVVLFGAEGESFTAGNDLADFAAVATGASAELEAHAFLDQLARTDKPIVAAVPGLAVGVGTTMLLHCDVVYLADSATSVRGPLAPLLRSRTSAGALRRRLISPRFQFAFISGARYATEKTTVSLRIPMSDPAEALAHP